MNKKENPLLKWQRIFLLKRDYFDNVVVAFNAIYPTIAETVEPNKIPKRERELMLSPASALKARLAKNIDIVKPDRKSTRLNSSHKTESRMPSSA